LGWPPAPHWVTISCVALSTTSSTTASDQIYFVWDSSKGKSTGSDLIPAYKRYYNLVCVLRRSNLGWPPAPHWATISYVALSTTSWTTASDQFNFVWDGSKGKSTGSDRLLTYKRYYNLVCVLRWSNLGWPPAPHWATIAYVALSATSWTGASDQLYFDWIYSKGKTTGSDHLPPTNHTKYNLICVLMRSNLGWPPSPHCATISCLALFTCAWSGASDQIYFVWETSKGKSTGSDRLLAYKPYYNLVCVLRKSNLGWSPAPHWATISCVALLTWAWTVARDQLYLVGIVAKVNQPAQTVFFHTNDSTTLYVYWGGQIEACHQHHIGSPYHVSRCPQPHEQVLETNYTLFGIVAKVNQPAQTIVSL